MVYRKTFKKRPYKKYGNTKRMMKRQMLKPKMNGKLRQPVHYFTRFQAAGDVTVVDNATNSFGVQYFELANVPGYTEFSAMYDFYKINAVQVKFIPISNVNQGVAGSAVPVYAYNNRFISAIDYNDRTVPTTLDELRQYSSCKVTPGCKIHKRFLHPRPTMVVDEDSNQGSSVGLAQTSGASTWVSTASNQTEWYGIKWGFEHGDSNITTYVAYRIEYKLYLSFKGKI